MNAKVKIVAAGVAVAGCVGVGALLANASATQTTVTGHDQRTADIEPSYTDISTLTIVSSNEEELSTPAKP